MKVLQAHRRVSVLVGANAATAARSATFDTLGAHNAAVCVALGPLANTSTGVQPAITLEESDVTNTGFGTWAGGFSSVTPGTVNATVKPLNVPLQGRKRYLKLTVTPGTTVATDALTTAAIAEFDDEIR